MKKHLLICLGIALFLSGFQIAHATLIQGNDSNQSVGSDGFNLTIDTDTNLQWLDLTAADARSYNDVELNFANGGDFEGYRHATRDEVLNLWANAGINHTRNFTNQPNNRLAILDLMDLLGLTFESSTNGLRTIASGWFNDIIIRPNATSPSRASLQQIIPLVPGGLCTLSECVGSFIFESIVFTFDSIQPATGNYLVLDQVVSSVPAPTTIWLLIFGLMGLIGMKRNSSKEILGIRK